MLQKKHTVYIYGAQVIFLSILCGIYNTFNNLRPSTFKFMWLICIFIIMSTVCTIITGAHGFNIEHLNKWLTIVARFTAYKLIMNGFNEACYLIYAYYKSKQKINVKTILIKSKQYIIICAAAITLLLYNKIQIITSDFLMFFIAYLITKYPEINQSLHIINYGVGMACSFFEGYLVHIIPSDGHKFVGFEENILAYEATHQIVFPVKRLIIVITKSLFGPPDLKHFNKNHKNMPFLEDCAPLREVQKDVAGVKNRIYRISTYKIHRPGAAAVYVSAICATPMNTLHRVLDRIALYDELANVNRHELRDDFCETLESIISRSPEARGKCELVFFDDEDPTQNLADILLDKIRQLEPDFENIISQKE